MNIWELDKLILFVAFVIPGFISIKTYELIFPGDKLDSSKQLVDAVTYSCINYALLAWPIYAIEQSQARISHPLSYGVFYVLVLLAAPVLWALLFGWLRTKQMFLRNAPHPTSKPWDYVFSQRKCYWIIVTLNGKTKTQIAGKYGPNSFTSSAPAEEQIYLEEAWVLNSNGGFDRPRQNTAGIIVTCKDIQSIELFEY